MSEPWYMSRRAGVLLAPGGWILRAAYRMVDRIDAHIDRRLDRG